MAWNRKTALTLPPRRPTKGIMESSEEEEKQATPRQSLWTRIQRGARTLIKLAIINLVASGEESSDSVSEGVTYVGCSQPASESSPTHTPVAQIPH